MKTTKCFSLVGSEKEKVWYHSNCNNRGAGCYNTNDVSEGGCTIWYDEMDILGQVEEHLKGRFLYIWNHIWTGLLINVRKHSWMQI